MENIQLTIAKQSKIYPISICKKKCHNWWLEWGFMKEINIKREEKKHWNRQHVLHKIDNLHEFL